MKGTIFFGAALLIGLAGLCPAAQAQSGEWAWMSGSSTVPVESSQFEGQFGLYGTLGTAAPGNVPGGRESAVSWTDGSGNLWLFGGLGYAAMGDGGALNDLWEFNAATREWTWVSGSNTANAYGMYGTLGTPAAGNVPGSRVAAVTWTDASGNLWLFGGTGSASELTGGDLNDLWMFSPSTQEWTWVSGSSTVVSSSAPGVYGTLDEPSAGNVPPGRSYAVGWSDNKGNLWLFGGIAQIPNATIYLNDLWEFDVSTQEWAWMGGSSTQPTNCYGTGTCGEPGIYGTLNQPESGNVPGARGESAVWTDQKGNFWLFGGEGFDSEGGFYYLNDLWEFNPSTLEWVWRGGSSTSDQSSPVSGIYGTLGVPAAGNMPGDREGPVGWTDQDGNLWLFGGFGFAADGSSGYLNDLWEFNPSALEWAWMGGSSTINDASGIDSVPGAYGTLGVPAAGNFPGSRNWAVSWTDPGGDLWLFGGVTDETSSAFGWLNDLWEYQPATTGLPTAATPTFKPPAGAYTAPQSVTIGDSTPGAVIYYTTNGTTPTSDSTLFSGAIAVSSSETIEAIAVAVGYTNSAVAAAAYTIDLPTAAAPTFNPPAGTYTSAQSVTIGDATADATIYYSIQNGTAPVPSPVVYSGPITVSSTETFQAFATAANYLNSPTASAAYTINLPPPGFTLSGVPAAVTLAPGGHQTYALTVTPVNGFNLPVGFTCTGLLPGSGCGFNAVTVTPNGGPATIQITFSADPLEAAGRGKPAPVVLGLALAGLLGLFGWRRRRGLRLVLIAGALAGFGVLSGCDGRLILLSSPATSTVSVIATSGSIQQSAPVTFTVN